MFLHNIPFERFDIALGDTLIDPKHLEEKPFDAIVSNPPYSTKWEGDSNPVLINDFRFAPAGVLAPKSKADLAFTMHILSHLSSEGTAAIVEFPGVLYRNRAEQKIRQYLVDNNYIDTIIQLPQNLFFGVTIPVCIIVLKKNKKNSNILFIDASNEFQHIGNKNKLTEANIETILNTFAERKELENFSKTISNEQIAKNDYNLSVSTYIEKADNSEKIDIDKLNNELDNIVIRQNELKAQINSIIEDLKEDDVNE